MQYSKGNIGYVSTYKGRPVATTWRLHQKRNCRKRETTDSWKYKQRRCPVLVNHCRLFFKLFFVTTTKLSKFGLCRSAFLDRLFLGLIIPWKTTALTSLATEHRTKSTQELNSVNTNDETNVLQRCIARIFVKPISNPFSLPKANLTKPRKRQ